MIQSFKCKHTRRFYEGERIPRFHAFARQATRRLAVLDSAAEFRDLAMLRSNRFEALGGDRAGQFGISINKQWRICFRWSDEGPYDIEITDYH